MKTSNPHSEQVTVAGNETKDFLNTCPTYHKLNIEANYFLNINNNILPNFIELVDSTGSDDGV
jgi:hypothetical protein